MTRVWSAVADWLDRRHALNGGSIGFVPTMGALHKGHESLVKRCQRENDTTVVSIFVNPLQFNNPKDLERYPRTLEADLKVLERLGVNEVIVPSAPELYPKGFRFRMELDSDAPLMEHAHRPGFLQGVMIVVLKLLNIVRANRAYFGEKDYQQLKIITDMVEAFFIPTVIVPCPTVREESGLAESSRNRLLSPGAKQKAACLYGALMNAANPTGARAMLEAQGFVVEYVEEHWGRRFAAVFVDGVRLIDNVPHPGDQTLMKRP